VFEQGVRLASDTRQHGGRHRVDGSVIVIVVVIGGCCSRRDKRPITITTTITAA
jgi:hypothetical protein